MALGWVKNIEELTKENDLFRKADFTGKHFQLTVMSIEVGDDIGLEVHPDNDQFIRIEQGSARVTFGPTEEEITEEYEVEDDWAIIIPAGVWHNVINTGDTKLKVYSLYAPPHHPEGTVHVDKAEAEAAEAAEHEAH